MSKEYYEELEGDSFSREGTAKPGVAVAYEM